MIQALVRRGVYHKDIAAELGVSPKTVSRALSRGSAPRGRRRRRVNKLDGQAPVVSSATNSGPSSVFPAGTSSQSRASPAGQASWLAGRGYPLNQSRFPPVGFRRVSAKLHWPLPTRLVRLPSSHEHRASPQLPNSLALRDPPFGGYLQLPAALCRVPHQLRRHPEPGARAAQSASESRGLLRPTTAKLSESCASVASTKTRSWPGDGPPQHGSQPRDGYRCTLSGNSPGIATSSQPKIPRISLARVSRGAGYCRTFARADARMAGEPVLTIGLPAAEIIGGEPKFTEGVISALPGVASWRDASAELLARWGLVSVVSGRVTNPIRHACQPNLDHAHVVAGR